MKAKQHSKVSRQKGRGRLSRAGLEQESIVVAEGVVVKAQAQVELFRHRLL